ncbi:MAG TPA: flavin reductase family protein [Rhizobiaceae bacterium]|nr:flavin reductase family protein [Rhizobiaceae bacterium]
MALASFAMFDTLEQKFQFEVEMSVHIDGPVETAIDAKTFWQAIGCRASGVAIVTVAGADGSEGFLALSATHLTASPPMVTVSLDKKTSAGPAIIESGAFAINYLSMSGRPLIGVFTSREGPKGPARFEGLDMSTLATGAPVLPDITGVLDCRVEEVIERYGVYLLIGRIIAFENFNDRQPLVHYQGQVLA